MKQIPLTTELISKIQGAVGEDVDPTGFAVFESISLNTLPLPGKDGTLFDHATVSLLTLKQMADSINGGNTLPLLAPDDAHNLSRTTPVGRVFSGQITLGQTGEAELRTLWYLDSTEAKLAQKVNDGSVDEVSVQFLASQILCSECEFDYRGEEATPQNFYNLTCANGHQIGKDGVHVHLVGLQDFSELSLVTRGAANKPKIVGKSQSKLAASLQHLAARGFEIDELYLAASKGEKNVDLTAILSQLTDKTTEAATAKAELSAVTTARDEAKTALSAATARITELETQLAAAGNAEAVAAAEASLSEATEFMSDVFVKLATAAGEKDAKAPATIADLKAGIEKHQSALTAILPVGGVSANTTGKEGEGSKFNASTVSAFRVNPR